MEVKPVKQIERPKYPLKTEFNEEELKKQIPKRWMKSPAAKIALGSLAVVALAGCGSEEPYVPEGSAAPATINIEASVSITPGYVPEDTYVPEGTSAPAMINVAPLFEHGEGKGAYGAEMASTPAFVSEDEALAVINEAAKEYGLNFTAAESPEFSGVLMPVTNILKPEIRQGRDNMIRFRADFADSEHNIVIEFVSVDDVRQWSTETGPSTYEQYYTKDAAEQISEALEPAVPVDYIFYTAAVLYDPCDFANSEAEARELSKEDLKAQVKDFFEWLKNQGVI